MSSVRSLRISLALVSLSLASTALAQRSFLLAQQDPAFESSFTLDFGKEFGGPASASITQTQYLLEINPAAGAARFIDYAQTADPLTLPGGVSTGDLTITVVPGSSSGTFAPDGTFSTSELYSIAFTGDLSLYGLTSPVLLPGASSGAVSEQDGTIASLWEGVGQLPNPFDPPNFITFTYKCQVHTIYAPSTPCAGDVDGDGIVDQADLGSLLAAFHASTGEPNFNPLADFDSDGTVGQMDLGVLLAAFGSTCE
ncbi:MAG TPA: hypothetical protein PKC49_08110 [Phycisphaerae bacterium]|nr:hypothetical protein [Phycisphaerae bacterium]